MPSEVHWRRHCEPSDGLSNESDSEAFLHDHVIMGILVGHLLLAIWFIVSAIRSKSGNPPSGLEIPC